MCELYRMIRCIFPLTWRVVLANIVCILRALNGPRSANQTQINNLKFPRAPGNHLSIITVANFLRICLGVLTKPALTFHVSKT